MKVDKTALKEINHVAKLLPSDVVIINKVGPIHSPGVNHRKRLKKAYENTGWVGLLQYVLPYYKPGPEKDRIQNQLNKILHEADNATGENEEASQGN